MNAHDPQRRTLLFGTLAAGVAVMFSGCKGKQEEGVTGVQPSPAPMSEMPPESQTAPSPVEAAPTGSAQIVKMSQAKAQYQAQPKGDQKCANCVSFIAVSDTCKIVEGSVSPLGWCIVWAAG